MRVDILEEKHNKVYDSNVDTNVFPIFIDINIVIYNISIHISDEADEYHTNYFYKYG